MFLINWIKEYFAVFFLGLILVWMTTFTLMSPSGFMGFLLWIGASVFASLMWNALCGLLIGPLYIIILRPALVIAVKVPLIILRILIFVFIATPLRFIGQSSSWIWNGFEASASNLITENSDGRTKPKIRFVAVFLLFLIGLTYVVGVDIETFSAMMRDATILAIPLMFVPLVLTLFVSAVSIKLSGYSFSERAETTYEDRIDRVDQAADIAENAAGIYNDLDHINQKRKAVEKNGSLKEGIKDSARNNRGVQKAAAKGAEIDSKIASSSSLSRIAQSLGKIPIVGRMAPWLEGVAGGSAIAILIVVLVILILIWSIVALLFVALFGGVMYATVFPFLESSFGVAAGYGADIGGMLSTGPEANLDAPSAELNALKLAGARIECMLQGPQCMTEWRRNNTERPGAESKGVEFGLEIEDFTVNSGQTLDISTRSQDDTIPMRFDVYNPIQGLKGIEARDAQYRVAIDGGPTTSCVTDWKDLGGQFVGDSDNSIAPGGFVRPGGELEDLTLKNCGALQPGYNQDMSAELEIKYEYSSQSTLQFRAMEQSYRNEEGIDPDTEESVTADTPVRTYINVQSPITFRNPQNGNGRAPFPFPIFVGFETTRFDLEYQVRPNDLKIYSSDLLTDVNRVKPSDFNIEVDEENDKFDETCSGLTHQSGNVYTLSDSVKERIKNEQERGEWHTKGLGPTEAQCSMVLAPDTINSISETGETLSMRIDGNYTVRLSSSTEDFDITNSRCGPRQYSCPFIVTKNEEEAENGKLSAECSTEIAVDATDGCTVIENTEQWASNPLPVNRDNQLSNTIENRETAYNLGDLVNNRITEKEPSGEYIQFNNFVEGRGNAYSDDAAVGLEPRNVKEANQSNTAYAITASESANPQAEINTIEDYYLCEGEDAESFVSAVMDTENVIYYKVPTISCGPSLWEQLTGSVEECSKDQVQAFNERSYSKECIS